MTRAAKPAAARTEVRRGAAAGIGAERPAGGAAAEPRMARGIKTQSMVVPGSVKAGVIESVRAVIPVALSRIPVRRQRGVHSHCRVAPGLNLVAALIEQRRGAGDELAGVRIVNAHLPIDENRLGPGRNGGVALLPPIEAED